MNNFHRCIQGNPIISCSPALPLGPTGPTGPRGPTGPSGQTGPTGAPGTFSPAYRNFWHIMDSQVAIFPGDTIPLNRDSTAMAGGITRTNNTITIPLAGDYFISYIVTMNTTGGDVENLQVSVFLGPPFTEVPNSQTRFRIANNELLEACVQLNGEAIITIPAGGSQLELRNTSAIDPIIICGFINDVALNIIKLSA